LKKRVSDATYLKNDDFGKSRKKKLKNGQEIQSCRDSPFKAIRPQLGLGFRVLATSEGCHYSAHDVCRERDDRLWISGPHQQWQEDQHHQHQPAVGCRNLLRSTTVSSWCEVEL
jgi:hypothetical protein